MMKKRLSKTLWYGSDIDKEGKPVLPPLAEEANDLEGIHEGELYLHLGDGSALLFTRSADGQVVQLGSNADELANYLLKSVWDKAFEIRVTETGEEYLFGKLNFATQYGITMYADGGLLDLPSIFEGIPVDNNTIYWEETKDEEGNVIARVLKSRGVGEGGVTPTLLGDLTNVGAWANAVATEDRIMVQKKGGSSWSSMLLSELGGGSADFSNVLSLGTGNAYTSFTLSEDKKTLTFLKGKTFAEKSTSLLGYGITDAYTKTQVDNLLGDFVTSDDVKTLLEEYLPLTGGTITGDLRLQSSDDDTISPYLYFGDLKEVYLAEVDDRYLTIHAYNGILLDSPKTVIDGIEIKKLASGALFIDANLVVSGGFTMYGTDGTTANTIWDDAPIASTTVKGIASFDSEFFAVNNGKVTFIGSTGGGGGTADSVDWADVTGKPSWIGSSKPSYSYSEITGTPTSLKNPNALSWSGHSSGSYDGSSVKSIIIPSNTNQLTNGAGFVTSSGSVAYATSAGSASKDGDGNVITETYFPITGGYISGDIIPDTSSSYYLGNADYIWDEVYAKYVNLGDTGEIYLYGTSDRLDIVTNSELRIKQGTTVSFQMDEYGNFGIWTTAPEATFHVNGDVQIDRGLKLWNNTYLSFYNSDLETTMSVLYVNRYNNLRIGKGISDEGYNTEIYGNEIYMGTETLYGDNWLLVDSSKGLGLKFIYDDDWYIQINLNDGNMYIGAGSANSLMIDNVGNLLIPEGATMHGTSDRRLKKNIRNFSASNVLMSLGGVYKFEYTENEVERNPLHSGTHIGLIYQDVKGTDLERMCHERADGYGTLNYLDSSFISLLAGVGMEHETRIQELEKENRELRKEIEKLKAA